MKQDNLVLYLFAFMVVVSTFLVQSKKNMASADITEDEIMKHIRFLSHDKRAGRYPGSVGSKDVIAYLVGEFKSYGLKPGLKNSYIQSFDITTGIDLGTENTLTINGDSLILETDYIPLGFSANTSAVGNAVFAGYGFNIDNGNLQWNDYQNLNVKENWVVVMRHGPEKDNVHSEFAPHSSLQKKVLVARDNGAIGVIFISQIGDEELQPKRFKQGQKNSGIPVIHLSNIVSEKLLKKYGWSRESIQKTMDRSRAPAGFKMTGVTISANIDLKETKTRAANVVAELRSGNRKHRDEYVLVGAHFDHIGMGGHGSGSRKPEKLAIHPGANDNASGTAGLLELAQKLASNRSRIKRSVLFVGFDAEEKGLLGAKHFVKNSPVDLENIITMINMDMIGRIKDSTAMVGGVGTSPVFKPLLDSLSKNRSFSLSMSKPGFGPSDHAAFYSENIPVLFFFSGFDDDYHTPNDVWKHINIKGQKDLVSLIYDVTYHLGRTRTPPLFSESGPKEPQMSVPKLRVTLGIMPSYTSTEIGLEIDAISKSDGPAAKAGLQRGDIIKSINNKTINNIYEYMERLGNLKPGDTVPVLVVRKEKELSFDVTF